MEKFSPVFNQSFAGLAMEAPEVQDRMQFDCVWGHSCLAVVEVEEGDPGDPCPRAEADVPSGDCHLPVEPRLGATVAERGGRLGDHVVAALLQDEMKI